MLKQYYYLTKPGIIRGNAIPAAAGFLLASKLHVHWGLFVAMLVGLSLIIASACVFNNYIDRDIDAKMARTKQRALVRGSIPPRNAIMYGAILGLVGALILGRFTNPLALSAALFGWFAYVILYTFSKRRTVHSTVIGSISGAVPPVVGYCAVTGRLDAGALILFLILVCWQMPHFYAISLYRLKDYQAAGLPILPVKQGARAVKLQILAYIAAFIVAAAMLTALHYTGYTCLAVVGLLGMLWLATGLRGFRTSNDQAWGRSMFLLSLVVIMVTSIMIPAGALLP